MSDEEKAEQERKINPVDINFSNITVLEFLGLICSFDMDVIGLYIKNVSTKLKYDQRLVAQGIYSKLDYGVQRLQSILTCIAVEYLNKPVEYEYAIKFSNLAVTKVKAKNYLGACEQAFQLEDEYSAEVINVSRVGAYEENTKEG